jgi:signal transduction histidine kinase
MAAVTPLPPTPVDPLTPLGKLRVRRLGSQESRGRSVEGNNQSSSGNPQPSNDYSSVRGVDVFGDDIAHDYVGRFPCLDHKRWREYRLHQKMFFDPYTSAFPATLLFMAQFTRFNLYQSYFAGPYFSVAFSIPFVGVPAFSLMLFMYGAKSVISDPSHWLRALARRWRHTWWGQMLDSLVLLLVTLQYGFVLYGRVAAGPCPPGTSIWDTQTCNPVAESHSIPQDQVLLLYMVPVLVQICVKAVHLHALAAAWVIVAAFVVAALQCVDGWRQLWTLLYLVLVVFISFEYERHSRVTFLESKKASLAEKAKRIALEEAIEAELQMQQERHRAEMLSLAAAEDKRLADREREQLTALVGNVAHDLKTPLQSFRMDLDLLDMILVRSGRSRDEASGSVSGSSDSQWNPLTVVKSLDTACCFMVMAINRSIEFVKVGGSVPSRPTRHDRMWLPRAS